MKRPALLALAAMLAAAPTVLTAQTTTITGTVRDQGTGNPVAAAQVFLEGLKPGHPYPVGWLLLDRRRAGREPHAHRPVPRLQVRVGRGDRYRRPERGPELLPHPAGAPARRARRDRDRRGEPRARDRQLGRGSRRGDRGSPAHRQRLRPAAGPTPRSRGAAGLRRRRHGVHDQDPRQFDHAPRQRRTPRLHRRRPREQPDGERRTRRLPHRRPRSCDDRKPRGDQGTRGRDAVRNRSRERCHQHHDEGRRGRCCPVELHHAAGLAVVPGSRRTHSHQLGRESEHRSDRVAEHPREPGRIGSALPLRTHAVLRYRRVGRHRHLPVLHRRLRLVRRRRHREQLGQEVQRPDQPESAACGRSGDLRERRHRPRPPPDPE